MSLLEKINQDIKAAMLAKEKDKLEALRAIKSALLLQKTEKGASDEIDEETEIKLLKRLVKQRKDASAIYMEQGRSDLAEPENFQSAVIESYLPQQMTEDQIAEVVRTIINELGASDIKDMGKVMGKAAKVFAGKADNSVVSGVIKSLLS